MSNTVKGKGQKKFTFKMQNKLLFIFICLIIVFATLIGRLIYLNNVDGERYEKQVLSRQSYVSAVIPFKRGDILDRNGTVLATSILQYKMILDPKKLYSCTEEEYTASLKAITEHFEISIEDINDLLKGKENSQYVVAKKRLGYQVVNEFEEKMSEDNRIKGVWFEQEYVRKYPLNTLACDLIGFSNSENRGFYGMEEYYNSTLNGVNGREYGYYDSELNIERIVKKAENGHSLVSTIDANIQRIVQANIKEFNETTGSKNLGIIIMNPNNGEIYAMASNEEYDLNNPRDLSGLLTEEEIASMTEDEKTKKLNDIWSNFCITYGFEPGSTFKPITVATGLEEAIISDHTTFVCDGSGVYGGHTIRCVNRSGHGEITLAESIMKSCNDALMQISALEGKMLFSDYQKRFNIGSKTGIDLPGEADGILRTGNELGVADLATYSFGQNFNTTMVQMAAAFSSIVNGGYYYQPHVVKSIITDTGATVSSIESPIIRQTISSQTSDLLKKYLYWTVEEGTAKTAQVEGYTLGGKTGTAQKYPRGNGKYLVSFIGCAPALNPEVVIYVVIDEATNVVRQDDSSLATKLAAKVMNEIMPHLSIYPEGEIDYLLEEYDELQEGTTGETGEVTGDGLEGTTGENTGDVGNANTSGEANTNGNSGHIEGDSNIDTQGSSNSSSEGNTQDANNNGDETVTPNENQVHGNGNVANGNDSTNQTDEFDDGIEYNGDAIPGDDLLNPDLNLNNEEQNSTDQE